MPTINNKIYNFTKKPIVNYGLVALIYYFNSDLFTKWLLIIIKQINCFFIYINRKIRGKIYPLIFVIVKSFFIWWFLTVFYTPVKKLFLILSGF